MFARRGEATPPTKLQTFFFGIRVSKVRIDPKHDIDLILRHFHPLDQRTAQVPFTCPVGFLQAMEDFGSKVFQTSNNQLQFCVRGRLIREMLALLFKTGETLAQAGNPGLKLVLINKTIRITPTGKPPPLAVRLAKALPFRRA